MRLRDSNRLHWLQDQDRPSPVLMDSPPPGASSRFSVTEITFPPPGFHSRAGSSTCFAWWHRPPRPDPVTRPHLLCRHRPDQAQPQRLLRQTNAGTFNLQTYFSSGLWKCPEQTATYFKKYKQSETTKATIIGHISLLL